MYLSKRRKRNGMGSIVQESATIAFDTARGMFFNPQTNTDYGPTPPEGGWGISWTMGDDNKILVLNQPGAPQTTKEQVISSLIAQNALTPAVAVANNVSLTQSQVDANTARERMYNPTYTPPMVTAIANTTNYTATSSTPMGFDFSGFALMLPNWLKNTDGSPNWTYIGVTGIGLYFAAKKFL